VTYRVISVDEATAIGFADASDNTFGILVADEPGRCRIVGWDGGAPEDQTLWRDWRWVPAELNRLAAEIERMRSNEDVEKGALRASIQDVAAKLERVTDERESEYARRIALKNAVVAYIYQYSLEHVDDCPQDDTCDCPLVRAIEKALGKT